MGRVLIKLNHAGIQSYLDGNHGVSALLHSKAEAVLAAAQADPHDDTGDYENGLEIQEAHTDRLAVRVVATDWKSYILEAKYGILSRALDAAG
jgi:hypothetical protein